MTRTFLLAQTARGLKGLFLALFLLFLCLPGALASERADAELGRALTRMYDQDYAGALALFRRMDSGNPDILFWTAVCAARTGDREAAIPLFRRLLKNHPQSARIRLELALALSAQGEAAAAREEIRQARAYPMPDEVRREMDRIEARLGRGRALEKDWGLGIRVGCQANSNITAGPDTDRPDDGIYAVILGEEGRKKAGTVVITDLHAHVAPDLFSSGGLALNLGLDLSDHRNIDLSELDTTRMDLYAGPAWKSGAMAVKVPLGYTYRRFGDETLSNAFFARPAVSLALDQNWSLLASYSLTRETFEQESFKKAGLDSTRQVLSAGPAWRSDGGRLHARLALAWEAKNADAGYQSYDGPGVAGTLYAEPGGAFRFRARVRYQNRHSDGPSPLYLGNRNDHWLRVSLGIARRIWKGLYGELAGSFTRNDSNQDLYAYTQQAAGIYVGYEF